MCGCVILWVCTLLFLKDKLARIGNVPEIYNGLIESVCQGFKRLLLLFLWTLFQTSHCFLPGLSLVKGLTSSFGGKCLSLNSLLEIHDPMRCDHSFASRRMLGVHLLLVSEVLLKHPSLFIRLSLQFLVIHNGVSRQLFLQCCLSWDHGLSSRNVAFIVWGRCCEQGWLETALLLARGLGFGERCRLALKGHLYDWLLI
jgi:hypothetical protein